MFVSGFIRSSNECWLSIEIQNALPPVIWAATISVFLSPWCPCKKVAFFFYSFFSGGEGRGGHVIGRSYRLSCGSHPVERGLCAVYAAVSAVQRRDGFAPFTQPSVPSRGGTALRRLRSLQCRPRMFTLRVLCSLVSDSGLPRWLGGKGSASQ